MNTFPFWLPLYKTNKKIEPELKLHVIEEEVKEIDKKLLGWTSSNQTRQPNKIFLKIELKHMWGR